MDSRLTVSGARATCPGCGRVNATDVVLLADAGVDPGCTQRILDEQVNQVACPGCGRSYLAPSPLLYRDPARELAVAYVPHAAGDAATLAAALVARALELLGVDAADDWLLSPLVVDEPKGLRRLVRLGRDLPEAADQAAFGPTLDLARRQGAPLVANALELLAPVQGLEALLALINAHPELLDPPLRQEAQRLADWATQRELLAEAEVLGDLLALLHAHTPPENDPDLAEEALPQEVRDRLVAGDLEAATDFLEKPAEHAQNARRAVFGIEAEDADRREGFYEHAALFGTLVHDMMEAEPPYDPDPPANAPVEAIGLPQVALDRLMACATPDHADEVLAAHPELLSPLTSEALRLAITQAIDRGDEPSAANYEMLLSVLLTAGAEEPEGDDD